jgi:NDP-sugar pyrophosphorylase family protein
MDAVVAAGGSPLPDEPLYPYTQGAYKALLDVAGKPMIQWVLDALSGAKYVDRVFIVGLTQKVDIHVAKPVFYVPDQMSLLENIRAGVKRVMEVNPDSHHVLSVSSDIPGITADMVDWLADTALQTDDDLYYNVIRRDVMEARYPASKRS